MNTEEYKNPCDNMKGTRLLVKNGLSGTSGTSNMLFTTI